MDTSDVCSANFKKNARSSPVCMWVPNLRGDATLASSSGVRVMLDTLLVSSAVSSKCLVMSVDRTMPMMRERTLVYCSRDSFCTVHKHAHVSQVRHARKKK